MTSAELAVRIAAAIDRVVWERSGPILAALRVIADPVIADGLRASETLAAIRGLHQPVRWAPDSPTVVCTAGCGAYPCKTRERLDGEP